SLPGGGAEIFAERVRRKICHDKADTDRYLSIHRIAHGLGLRSNVTMLYGHIETMEERVDHMLRSRALQDETGGFQAFIPLAFHPDNNPLGQGIAKPSGLTDLKMMAIARLMLDNFPHIKAYWQMLGVKIAQVAQSFGADDMDGTVVHETIYHAAGSDSPQELGVADLRRLIEEAGREPVERDTLYREVIRDRPPKRTGKRLVLN
ncbi:MAG TPA: aminofutalosine synthase MqnE, partial [Gemmataceae bacterium]